MKTLADLAGPAEIEDKPLLEADLRKKCKAWARNRGYWARTFVSISNRSVPDDIFSGRGVKFAAEAKRPGTKPKLIEKYGVTVMSTEAQYEEQIEMRNHGWTVFEYSDFEVFKSIVLLMEKGEWP